MANRQSQHRGSEGRGNPVALRSRDNQDRGHGEDRPNHGRENHGTSDSDDSDNYQESGRGYEGSGARMNGRSSSNYENNNLEIDLQAEGRERARNKNGNGMRDRYNSNGYEVYGSDDGDQDRGWGNSSSRGNGSGMNSHGDHRTMGLERHHDGSMQDGPHVGKGPKGYQRSDERIHEDVSERLTNHGQVDARGIEVGVEGGEVTLSGTVPDREMKRHAEDCVEGCSGVSHVQNNLRWKQNGKEAQNGSDSRNGKMDATASHDQKGRSAKRH